MASKLTIYTDTLLYPAVLKRVNEAQSSIKIMVFVRKANYGTPNLVDDHYVFAGSHNWRRGVFPSTTNTRPSASPSSSPI